MFYVISDTSDIAWSLIIALRAQKKGQQHISAFNIR